MEISLAEEHAYYFIRQISLDATCELFFYGRANTVKLVKAVLDQGKK